MYFRMYIVRFLAIFVIAGLVAGPLAGPAAAKSFCVTCAMDMSVASVGLPCCPDEQSNDCQDCPLVALCMASATQAEPTSVVGIVVRLSVRHLFSSFDDLIADSLGGSPPDHPPRTLV